MKKFIVILGCISCASIVSGCKSKSDNLLFVDTNTLGVNVTAAGAQGASARLGYASLSVARVPVVARNDITGHPTQLGAMRGGPANTGTYSVFASFQSNTTGQDIGLGRVFATGFAAQEIGTGVKHKLATSQSSP